MNSVIKRLLRTAQKVQKNRKHSTTICPDQCVGKVKFTPFNGFELVDKVTTHKMCGSKRINIDAEYVGKNNAAIVLILESPHIDEFGGNKIPIGPAYGKTGENINNYFIDILNDGIQNGIINLANSSEDKIYDFILINAIQYQTSLGVDTLIYRDAMFLRCWEHNRIKKNFLNRLRRVIEKYGQENIILINGCTQGEHLDLITNHKGKITHGYLKELGYKPSKGKQSLQRFVSEVIKLVVIKEYYVSHPSSWSVKKNRVLKN